MGSRNNIGQNGPPNRVQRQDETLVTKPKLSRRDLFALDEQTVAAAGLGRAVAAGGALLLGRRRRALEVKGRTFCRRFELMSGDSYRRDEETNPRRSDHGVQE